MIKLLTGTIQEINGQLKELEKDNFVMACNTQIIPPVSATSPTEVILTVDVSSKPEPKPSINTICEDLLEKAEQFWKHEEKNNPETRGNAVKYVSSMEDGALVLFTRGEYAEQLIAIAEQIDGMGNASKDTDWIHRNRIIKFIQQLPNVLDTAAAERIYKEWIESGNIFLNA